MHPPHGQPNYQTSPFTRLPGVGIAGEGRVAVPGPFEGVSEEYFAQATKVISSAISPAVPMARLLAIEAGFMSKPLINMASAFVPDATTVSPAHFEVAGGVEV